MVLISNVGRSSYSSTIVPFFWRYSFFCSKVQKQIEKLLLYRQLFDHAIVLSY